MRIYFCGIGGAGLAPLAHLAVDCGFVVTGSDMTTSLSIPELQDRGIPVSLNQDGQFLHQQHTTTSIDLFVYSSAIPPEHPEYAYAQKNNIRSCKRDELISIILQQKKLQMLAVAGTHGKTTTTAMLVWLFQQLGEAVSYSIGSNITFGRNAGYQSGSRFFVYEADEFDKNFLHFQPHGALITSLDYDHPDTYPTSAEYFAAFEQFSRQSHHPVFVLPQVANQLRPNQSQLTTITYPHTSDESAIMLPGLHNRHNAWLAMHLAASVLDTNPQEFIPYINTFPGTQRRLEQLKPGLFSDYAHHPTEIRATLQALRETAQDSQKIIAVYQPHQNIRQHSIRTQYQDCFADADQVAWLPTYLSREDKNLPILHPSDLIAHIHHLYLYPAKMDTTLAKYLQTELRNGSLVACLGAGSIDDWAREYL